jgi:hypothetical protein
VNHIYEASGGKPIILTENGTGTTEQGLAAPTLLVADQTERGLRYRNYVEGAAGLGYIVGAHWFTYLDQAGTARWSEGENGERFNFGLLNVADRPYKTFLEKVMQTNHDIYNVALGNRAPFFHDFHDDPRLPGNNEINIPYTAAPIPIDGVINGFPAGVQKVTLEAAHQIGGIANPAMKSDFYLAWDENNLYMTAKVTDPTPMMNAQRDLNVWKGDNVEMFFGPGDLTTPGDPLFNDRQLIMSAQMTDGQPFWYWFFTNRQKPVNMIVQASPDGQGYILEAAIPWSTVNMTAAAGTEFKFDFGFDNSDTGLKRIQQWMWNGTPQNSTDRSMWGRAKLVQP